MAKVIDLAARARNSFYGLTFEEQLDHLCNKWELRPVGYFDHAHGRIYVAEGWLDHRPEDGRPGWTVMYAIRRRGACLAQPMYLATDATREQRLEAALSAAFSFLREEMLQQNLVRHG